ncbi:MAG: NAD-dependent epimerase/dehydratase family protein [Eubacteriales bacterium]
MMSFPTQAALDNPYGRSKKAGEELVLAYGRETSAQILIYRFPNVFGKWCRPNYNNAVATLYHNIARNLPITVNDPGVVMTLVYIDDVMEELLRALQGRANCTGDFYAVPVVYTITLGKIVDLIYSFRNSRQALSVPDMADGIALKLYSTYFSYQPTVIGQ